MFISAKRHEREKLDIIAASNRLTDAMLKGSPQGLFLLEGKERTVTQTSTSLAALFRRQDFINISFEKLIGPLVSVKTLSTARTFIAKLFDPAASDEAVADNPLLDVELKVGNTDGSFSTVHYSFEFNPVQVPREARAWLVRVTDITNRVQQTRELEDLRVQVQTQGEILRAVLRGGGARFAQFLERTDASMRTINEVLKKPARQADAFRSKLEETLAEVDRVRRDAAAFKLTGLESGARLLEDSLQDLRTRGALSGSDFLPLAVKLDQLYGQFAMLRTLTTQAGAIHEPDEGVPEERITDNGTAIIEAPKFDDMVPAPEMPKSHRMAQAGSLDSTLASLTELVAHEQNKTVVLESLGLHLVPAQYQSTIKKVSIQMIRNAVMHGVETLAEREAAGKPPHGTLHLEFKVMPDESCELHFQDDGRGLDPDQVRITAVKKGVLTEDAAARLRDRQAIKLIFKSRFSTLEDRPGEAPHGAGMAMVRRYVQEAGGKVALASLLGHETRFKIMLPAPGAAAEPGTAKSSDDPPAAQVA